MAYDVPSNIHVLLSSLHALSEANVTLLFVDMDVLLLRRLDDHPQLGLAVQRTTGSWPDILISGHAHHPRVNIGLMLLRATAATRAFLRELEAAWRRTHGWDQALFDALLHNHDTLPPGRTRYSDAIAVARVAPRLMWRKLDACAFAECGLCPHGQCAGRFGSLTRHECALPPAQVYTWHLTALNLSAKLTMMRMGHVAYRALRADEVAHWRSHGQIKCKLEGSGASENDVVRLAARRRPSRSLCTRRGIS